MISAPRSRTPPAGPAQADQSLAHQVLRLHGQSRRAAHQQHIRAGNPTFRRVPKGHQRFPVRLGRSDPRRISIRHRHGTPQGPARLRAHPRPHRRKLRRRLTSQKTTPVSNYGRYAGEQSGGEPTLGYPTTRAKAAEVQISGPAFPIQPRHHLQYLQPPAPLDLQSRALHLASPGGGSVGGCHANRLKSEPRGKFSVLAGLTCQYLPEVPFQPRRRLQHLPPSTPPDPQTHAPPI